MNLNSTLRKLAATAVAGVVIAGGGIALADEHDLIADEEARLEPAPEETVAEDPVLEDEVVTEDPVVEEDVVTEDPTVEEDVVTEDPVVEDGTQDPVVDDGTVVDGDAPLPEADDTADVDDTEADDTAADEDAPVVEERPMNHGAAVSAVAQAPTPEGARNHGAAVSEVARSDAGKPAQAGKKKG